jgi:cell wall-associated NlpC family hydrolase
MAKTSGISGKAVALATAGGLLVYAGLRGQSPLESLRGVMTGKVAPIPAGKPVTLSGGDWGGGDFGGTAPAASGTVARAAQIAVQQVGKPYRWATTGPNTFDCSGLIVYSYRQAGIPLPRYWSGAFLTSTSFRKIKREEVTAGDVCWKPGHVALATSNNAIVEAPRTGIPVRTRALSGFTIYLRYVGSTYNPGLRGPR